MPGLDAAGSARLVQAAGAVAHVVARAWITGIEPRLTIEGMGSPAGQEYLEHLALEAIDASEQVAVFTLLATMIGGNGDDFAVSVRRVAVPVTLAAQPQPAGTPWWLPDPTWHVSHPAVHQVDDPNLLQQALYAVAQTGYTNPQVRALEQTEHGTWAVTFDAGTSSADTFTHRVLLHRRGDDFVVAGTRHLAPAIATPGAVGAPAGAQSGFGMPPLGSGSEAGR